VLGGDVESAAVLGIVVAGVVVLGVVVIVVVLRVIVGVVVLGVVVVAAVVGVVEGLYHLLSVQVTVHTGCTDPQTQLHAPDLDLGPASTVRAFHFQQGRGAVWTAAPPDEGRPRRFQAP